MLNSLLAAWNPQYTMFLVLGGFVILMIVMTIIPQRSQKKKQETMMNSIQLGDRIMTIGGFVGAVEEYDPSNDQYVINVGTPENPTHVTIVKHAIRQRLDGSRPASK